MFPFSLSLSLSLSLLFFTDDESDPSNFGEFKRVKLYRKEIFRMILSFVNKSGELFGRSSNTIASNLSNLSDSLIFL